MKIATTLIAFAVLIATARAVDNKRPEALKREDVRIQNERFRITFARLNPAQMVAFYADGAEARFPGFPPSKDRAFILAAYKGLFKTPATLAFTKTTLTTLGGGRYRTRNEFLVTEFRASGTSTRTGTISLTWEFRGALPKIILDVTKAEH